MKQHFQHRSQFERPDLAEQIEDAMRRQGVNERRLEREIAARQGRRAGRTGSKVSTTGQACRYPDRLAPRHARVQLATYH
jgi:hypothetical protein